MQKSLESVDYNDKKCLQPISKEETNVTNWESEKL